MPKPLVFFYTCIISKTAIFAPMKAVIDDKIPFIKGEIEKLVDETVYLKGSEIGPKDVADADILVVRTRTHCNEALLKDSRVRLIVTATIGHDHLDKDYLKQAGIQWTNCPGCNASSVCQYIHNSLLVLGLLKKGLTVGVVGVGHVGTLVANDLEKKGMRVLRCDPPKEKMENEESSSSLHASHSTLHANSHSSFSWYSLPQLAKECDIITFHTPLTKDGEYPTYHMADAAFFASLRKKPLIINSSRGPVVDNEALLHALESGQVSNAVIDTWEGEPKMNLKLLEKAIIATPHIAGYSADGKANATRMSLQAIAQFLMKNEECRMKNENYSSSPHASRSTLHASRSTFNVNPPRLPKNFSYADTEPKVEIDPLINGKAPNDRISLYDPRVDTARLKAHPEAFESLRGNYPLRREVNDSTALRRFFLKAQAWLQGLSFRTGVIVLLSCIPFYILSFAQMALPTSAATKTLLWTILFGLAKTAQYSGLTILGVEGYRRLKNYFKKK